MILKFVRLIALFAVVAGYSIGAIASNTENIDQVLIQSRQLNSYESWAEILYLTDHIVQSCDKSNPSCISLTLLNIKSLYGQNQKQKADELLFKVDEAISILSAENTSQLALSADIIRAFGLRRSGSKNLDLSQLLLRKILASNPIPSLKLQVLNELAFVTQQIKRDNEISSSESIYKEALLLAESLNDEEGILFAKVGLGFINRDKGNYIDSIRIFEDLIATMVRPGQIVKYINRVSVVYGNLGAAYKNIGNYQASLINYELAREYSLKFNSKPDNKSWIYGIASAHRLLGNSEYSLKLLNEKHFPFIKPNEDAFVYRERALTYVALGKLTEANEDLKHAITLKEQFEGRWFIGEYYADLAGILILLNTKQSLDEAIAISAKGLITSFNQDEIRPIWQNEYALYRAYKLKGEDALAIYWGKHAINLLEEIRDRNQISDDETQATLLRSVQYIYEDLSSLLIKNHRFSEAEQVLNFLKSNESHQLSRSVSNGNQLEFNSSESKVKIFLVNAYKELKDIFNIQIEFSKQKEINNQLFDKSNLNELIKVQSANQMKFVDHLNQIQSMLSESTKSTISEAGEVARDSRFEKLDLDLKKGNAALTYIVTEKELVIVLTLPDSNIVRYLPISKDAISDHVTNLRTLIQNQSNKENILKASQQLFNILIRPILKELQLAKVHTLVLVTTKTLRYLPFTVLHDGEKYLIENYAIANYSHFADNRKERALPDQRWKNTTAFGLTESVVITENDRKREFPSLKNIKTELYGIVKSTLSPHGLLNGKIEMDQAFTFNAFGESLKNSNLIHLATHYYHDTNDTKNSYLVLGDGSSLKLSSLAKMKFENVDMVTLAACDTATGKGPGQDGREVEGLASTILNRGAKTTLATLWRIQTYGTQKFMENFYSNAMSKKADKRGLAFALKDAQNSMIKQKMQRNNSTINVDYSHPYFWAPFLLMGNWY